MLGSFFCLNVFENQCVRLFVKLFLKIIAKIFGTMQYLVLPLEHQTSESNKSKYKIQHHENRSKKTLHEYSGQPFH